MYSYDRIIQQLQHPRLSTSRSFTSGGQLTFGCTPTTGGSKESIYEIGTVLESQTVFEQIIIGKTVEEPVHVRVSTHAIPPASGDGTHNTSLELPVSLQIQMHIECADVGYKHISTEPNTAAVPTAARPQVPPGDLAPSAIMAPKAPKRRIRFRAQGERRNRQPQSGSNGAAIVRPIECTLPCLELELRCEYPSTAAMVNGCTSRQHPSDPAIDTLVAPASYYAVNPR
ncbi:hypothetical protein EDC01DRAFT_636876 [Geopyxis carbonaria]|nr:hypothetical protein EDC01DRAFT_636876 [Geopyxis carbonaria]